MTYCEAIIPLPKVVFFSVFLDFWIGTKNKLQVILSFNCCLKTLMQVSSVLNPFIIARCDG